MFLVSDLQQPRPVACSSCNSNGHIECKWCAGTGFFVLGDNMLCQVPSKSTSCVICTGKVNQILICQYPSLICGIIPMHLLYVTCNLIPISYGSSRDQCVALIVREQVFVPSG